MAQDQKGAHAESAWLVFFDESGISLIPPVRRTWSPRGRTPILRHRMAWKRASMAAALGYHPDGTSARLCFHLQQDAYDTDSLIGVLEQLAGFYAGSQVVLLWDGLSSHWSHKMRAHLDKQGAWLTVERLPAYAPELNPVEYLWANLNGATFHNLVTFSGAVFEQARQFGPLLVAWRLDLNDVVFHTWVQLEVAAASLRMGRTQFVGRGPQPR